MSENLRLAIHEAGHFVAARRFGMIPNAVTIVPDDELGSDGHCCGSEFGDLNAEAAKDQVIELLAGYAAVLADGRYDAERGTADDYRQAERLLSMFELGTLGEWKAKAAELMREPGNVKAVAAVAAELCTRWTLQGEFAAVLVEVADGDTTEEEFASYIKRCPPFELHLKIREKIAARMAQRS